MEGEARTEGSVRQRQAAEAERVAGGHVTERSAAVSHRAQRDPSGRKPPAPPREFAMAATRST